MLFLGIDQHARQLTISLRNEDGDVILARQVSTQPAKVNEFFQRLTRERLRTDEQFVAVLEVCGFNDRVPTRGAKSLDYFKGRHLHQLSSSGRATF